MGEFSYRSAKKKPSGGHLNLFNLQEKMHDHIVLLEHPSGAKSIKKYNKLNHKYYKDSSLYPADWNDIDSWNAMIRALNSKNAKMDGNIIKGFDISNSIKIEAYYSETQKKILSHFPNFEK